MNRYDRNKTQNSSRFPIILLLCLIGGTWIYNVYDDIGWVRSENITFREIISKKDEQISSLIKIVDSLTYKSKDVILHEELKTKFIKKADTTFKKILKDTTSKTLTTKIDSIR
jgi:hypothetical protein